jgi:hypothetical protein
MVGSERQCVLNLNLQLFASIVRGCGALQTSVEGTTTTTATATRCTYVVNTSNSNAFKGFSGSLMC